MELENYHELYKICKIVVCYLVYLRSCRSLFTYLPLLTARYDKYMKFPEESHFSSQFKSYRRNR